VPVYPDRTHTVVADALESHSLDIRTATLGVSEHGLAQKVPDDTDVLGHAAHDEVADEIVKHILANAAVWAASGVVPTPAFGNHDSLEDIDTDDERSVH